MGRHQEDDGLNPNARRIIRHKASKLIGNYGFLKSDREDVEQELTLYVLLHQCQYDPNRSNLNTFLSRIIDNKIASMIEYRCAAKRDCRLCRESLDEEIDNEGDAGFTLHDTYCQDDYLRLTGSTALCQEEQNALSIDLDTIINTLPELLQRIARLLKVMSISDVARTQGMPRTTVNEYRNKLREIFRRKGMKDYF